jgi:hypothetical protein
MLNNDSAHACAALHAGVAFFCYRLRTVDALLQQTTQNIMDSKNSKRYFMCLLSRMGAMFASASAAAADVL